MSTGGDQLDPDRLEGADFPVVRRGFEQEMVRTQLGIAADEIRRLRNLMAELEREISALEARPPVDLEAERITEAIGEEAVKVLDAARIAAVERAARAEAEAAEIVAGAERMATDLRSEAEADRDRILEQARLDAEEVVEQGRARGRDMVAEARTVRERMLRDLAVKRQTHRAEVERLRAGRDRLLESLVDAQQALDSSTAELVNAVPEAQAAAERAGLRVNSEPQLTVEQLEAEIATARLVEHPLVEGVPEPGWGDDEGAALYDLAAEATADAEVAAGSESADGGGSVGDEEETAGVDELFDRLRSSRREAVADAEMVFAAESEVADAEMVFAAESEVADAEMVFAAESEEVSGEPGEADETVLDEESEEIVLAQDHEEESGGQQESEEIVLAQDHEEESGVDPDEAARAEAVAEIARSLKRLVVDEQGDLLDGLRRDGTAAVRVVLDRDEARYVGVLVEPLEGMVSAVAGEGVEIVTDDAVSSLKTLLVEPVRSRLEAALAETDDPDELSTTVRAVYRECRSRRVDEAADAAVGAVYRRALETRSSTPG